MALVRKVPSPIRRGAVCMADLLLLNDEVDGRSGCSQRNDQGRVRGSRSATVPEELTSRRVKSGVS